MRNLKILLSFPILPSVIIRTILASSEGQPKLTLFSTRLYIKPNGEIKYTQGKSGGISSVDLVGITAYENGAYTYGGAAWRACPIEGSDPPQWQVFAELPGLSFNSSCIPFEGLVKNDTSGKAGAWAYT